MCKLTLNYLPDSYITPISQCLIDKKMIAAVWVFISAHTHLHAESTEDKYSASAPLCSSHKLHTCAKASLDTKSSPSWHKIAALNPERLLATGVAVCQQYDVQGWHPTCFS